MAAVLADPALEAATAPAAPWAAERQPLIDAVRAIVSSGAQPGTVLMRSSRTGNGRVTGRAAFDTLGILPADNLSPQKARILLMLSLTRTHDPREIARIFSEY